MKSIVSWLRRRRKDLSPATEGANDGVSRLPLELHFYILAHFEPGDLAVALNVCRSWRYIWLSNEVWPWLAVRWFPGLLEQISLSATTETARGNMFRRTLVIHQLRSQGQFSHALQHCMKLESDNFFKLGMGVSAEDGGIHSYSDAREPEPDLERFARFRLYSNGRIAWWPEPYALPYIAVVDDLRKKIRRVYSFPDHCGEQVGYQTALGDKLFIMGKERTLHAWHLEKDTHRSIELPYHFKRCVTEGETVLVIAKDSTVYLWDFDQPLRHIDMSSIYNKAPVTWGGQGDFAPSTLGPHRVGLWLLRANTAIDFIVHPTIKHVFFVVTLRGGTLAVHEVDGDKLIKSYIMGENLLSRQALESSGQPRWERIDTMGGYNLLSIYPMPLGSLHADQNLEELCREISCRCQTWWRVGGHTLVSVCFNIYTKCFEILRHQPPSFYQPRSFHIWNQQLFAAGRSNVINGWHVASFGKYTGWSDAKALADVPFYSTSNPKQVVPTMLSRRRMRLGEFDTHGLGAHDKLFYDIEYIMDANRLPIRDRTPLQRQIPDTIRLVGDDNFMIFFEDEMYTAWYFDGGAK